MDGQWRGADADMLRTKGTAPIDIPGSDLRYLRYGFTHHGQQIGRAHV